MEPESRNCEAIMQAWYGGERGGGAVADILFGDYNPSGKLPITFYKNDSQLPDFEDYKMAGRTYRYFKGEPLFKFGHGLSYTSFAYGKLALSSNTMQPGGEITVSVDITNTGDRAGKEIVQL